MSDKRDKKIGKFTEEINLVEVFTFLWSKRKFITLVVCCFLGIGLIYVFLIATPMYESTISLYPADQNTQTNSGLMQMVSQLGIGGGYQGSLSYNIPDIVKSRTFCEDIVRHKWQINFENKLLLLDLREYFHKINNIEKPEDIRTEIEEKKWLQKQYYRYANLLGKERFLINQNKESGLIKISIYMENPILATDIVNFSAELITKYVNKQQKENASKNRKFVENRLDLAKAELTMVENDLKDFREKNRNIGNSPELQLEFGRLQRKLEVKQEVYITLIKQRELSLIEENKQADIVQVLDNGIVPDFPSSPNKKLVLIVFLLLGICFAMSLIFVKKLYYFVFSIETDQKMGTVR